MSESFPAATVVPLRDGADGLEVLMLRKNSKLAFGGMWVFPGGRVDPADCLPGESRSAAEPARRAAVREAVEEAALLLDVGSLVPFSHWEPPSAAPKRFNTWFFLAPVREAVEVVIDMGEIHDHGWLSPGDALARRDVGEYELAPPTWMTLWRLARAAAVDDALAEAAAVPVEYYTTRMVIEGPLMTAVWAGDAAYEGAGLDAPGGRRRLVMDPAGWRYEGG